MQSMPFLQARSRDGPWWFTSSEEILSASSFGSVVRDPGRVAQDRRVNLSGAYPIRR